LDNPILSSSKNAQFRLVKEVKTLCWSGKSLHFRRYLSRFSLLIGGFKGPLAAFVGLWRYPLCDRLLLFGSTTGWGFNQDMIGALW
jgi:hypothetical protein